MKKQLIFVFVLLGLGIFTWAQGENFSFDAKKSREELQIMEGSFRAIITLAEENLPQYPKIQRTSLTHSRYLAGQGAVFVIPISGIPSERILDPSDHLTAFMYAYQLGGCYARKNLYSTQNSNSNSPSASQPSTNLSAMLSLNGQTLPEILGIFRQKVVQNQDTTKVYKVQFLHSPAEIKIGFLETLANYGDLLTTVKSNKFINLILEIYNDDKNTPPDVQRIIEKQYEILSAQKSWITEHKAGNLSLEDFKQKVLGYSTSGD